ncbi:DUF4258 domain-containing protein [Micrococcus luteus]|uniref:DUF4258 domain-containing protein n=1 Tax=Micrococcus luteus TaxID=1270 RepID=UPI001009766C|nr:hypothetical protein MT1254_11145 [Micrococcus luteus]
MRLILTKHVRDRLRERGITADEVHEVLTPHRVLQSRPGDGPGKAVYLVELPSGRRIEVVTAPPIADAPPSGRVRVVTAWVYGDTA